jgi:hypothetical protein
MPTLALVVRTVRVPSASMLSAAPITILSRSSARPGLGIPARATPPTVTPTLFRSCLRLTARRSTSTSVEAPFQVNGVARGRQSTSEVVELSMSNEASSSGPRAVSPLSSKRGPNRRTLAGRPGRHLDRQSGLTGQNGQSQTSGACHEGQPDRRRRFLARTSRSDHLTPRIALPQSFGQGLVQVASGEQRRCRPSMRRPVAGVVPALRHPGCRSVA